MLKRTQPAGIQTKPIVDRLLGVFPQHHSLDVPLTIFRTIAGNVPPAALSDLGDFATGKFTQKHLSHLIDTSLQTSLLQSAFNNGDRRSSARLRSLTLPFAGAFLNVIPSRALGLSILPQAFRIALQYRLGLPVYPASDGTFCPACGKPFDIFGDHTITCASDALQM